MPTKASNAGEFTISLASTVSISCSCIGCEYNKHKDIILNQMYVTK